MEMHHFARRTAGFTAVLATGALLLASGCSNDDDKDKNDASAMTTTSMPMEHSEEHTAGAAEETKIATQGGEIVVSDEILAKYKAAGGPNGPLGAPEEAVETGPDDGKYQDFTGGTIFWRKDGGPHIVWGEIREAWEAEGGANGKLGYPTTDEKDIAGGKQSDFTGGTITWVDGQTTVTPKA
jgi:uncharacterized protein with LGFP repeats